jgi:hypothetical protein
MSRLNEWVKKQKNAGLSEYQIACGLDNGDLERPTWLRSSPTVGSGYTIWDGEVNPENNGVPGWADVKYGIITLDTTKPAGWL